jgi:hypothetical protein
MPVEIVTKDDLKKMKEELLADFAKMLSEKSSPDNRYLSSAEVRELLKLSKGTLQYLRESNQLPCIKIGRKIFFEMKDIEKMMSQNRW